MEETRADAQHHVSEKIDTIISEIGQFQHAISDRVTFLADLLDLLISDPNDSEAVKAFDRKWGHWLDAQQN